MAIGLLVNNLSMDMKNISISESHLIIDSQYVYRSYSMAAMHMWFDDILFIFYDCRYIGSVQFLLR